MGAGRFEAAARELPSVVAPLLLQEALGFLAQNQICFNLLLQFGKEIQLKTLLDEKMFVASLICDRNYCSALCSDYVQNENNFTDKTMRDLLELIRVDLHLTKRKCQNILMNTFI